MAFSSHRRDAKLHGRVRVPQSIPNYAARMAYSSIDTSLKYATFLSSVCGLVTLTEEINMQIVGWMMLLLLMVARPALAAFEGYIEMKMTMKEGTGTMRGQISSVGARTEVEARVAQMGDLPVT